jgi:hypothetical protein
MIPWPDRRVTAESIEFILLVLRSGSVWGTSDKLLSQILPASPAPDVLTPEESRFQPSSSAVLVLQG